MPISIHAPRAGSDTNLILTNKPNISISIHAPRAGSDPALQAIMPVITISIHAPRAGSDMPNPILQMLSGDFNPRSPCGERRQDTVGRYSILRFQSTLPVRGATGITAVCKYYLCIFQSTLPVRGATRTKTHHSVGQSISIHAPRAGSDC